jgi:hypothetical protein
MLPFRNWDEMHLPKPLMKVRLAKWNWQPALGMPPMCLLREHAQLGAGEVNLHAQLGAGEVNLHAQLGAGEVNLHARRGGGEPACSTRGR